MTHSCVNHLPLPLWLNEGLAHSIEGRFAPMPQDAREVLDRLAKQPAFWTEHAIQEFWSGHAFQRPDKRQEMAYQLALSMTKAFAQDWAAFKAFVLSARADDAELTMRLVSKDTRTIPALPVRIVLYDPKE